MLHLKPEGSSPIPGEPSPPLPPEWPEPSLKDRARGLTQQYDWLTSLFLPPTAVSEYFGGSCVPGAGETSYSKSLCRLCRGNAAGEGVCDKSPLERYYDYSGAFR